MVGHNKIISKNHFHKDWTRWMSQNFKQVLKKRRRNLIRERKARAMAPAPLKALRPIVHCPSARYNSKQRLGRGFSLAEIRSVGMTVKEARSVGIKVDHRRRNKSVEGLMVNRQRLQQYNRRMIILSKNERKFYKDPIKIFTRDVNEKDKVLKMNARNKKGGNVDNNLKPQIITQEMSAFSPYVTLRQERGKIKKMKNRRKKLAKKQVDDIK